MRPGAKASALRSLNAAIEALEQAANTIRDAQPEPLLSVGVAWGDAGTRILIGDTYKLTRIESRLLIARLVAAVYCAERGGNTESTSHQAHESRFLDLLKGGLMFALNEDQIRAIEMDP